MKYKEWMLLPLIIIVFGAFSMVGYIICVSGEASAIAASPVNWEPIARGTITDVDPFAGTSDVGLLFELDTGSWMWIWSDKIVGKWPCRGQQGIFYKARIGGTDKNKWVIDTKSTKKVIPEPKIVPPKSPSWNSILTGLPPINKTVLVKYANGTTITTAYLNDKKEWKLETDKERVGRGRVITIIKQWREIPK